MTSDYSVEAILREFRDDILKDVNAKVCAPELRREEVIAESTETDINQARSVKRANGILYDYLRENCTLDQIVMLSRVLTDVDKGYRRTRTLGQRLHARTQGLGGGGTYQQESQNGSQRYPPQPRNGSNRALLFAVLIIPCIAITMAGTTMAIFCKWQPQMCQEWMPWIWGACVEESGESSDVKVKADMDHLMKPTFAERAVSTDVSGGNFYKGKWVYTGTATDVATGLSAKGKNYASKGGAKEHAIANLKNMLLEKGIIRED